MLPNLWKHQENAINTVDKYFCLFFDTGTGKTRTELEIIKREKPNKVLIVSPLSVCRNWINEIHKYLGERDIFLIAGQDKKVKLKILEKFNNFQGPCFLVINTDTLRNDDLMNQINRTSFDYIVVDEAHDFKSPPKKTAKGFGSYRTGGLVELCQKSKPKFLQLLTASPSPQGEIDLYVYMLLTGYTDLPFVIWRKTHFIDVKESEESNRYLWKLFVWLKFNKETAGLEFNKWKSHLLTTIREKPISPLKKLWTLIVENKLCATPWAEWQMDMIDRVKAYPLYRLQEQSKEYFANFLKTKTLTANKNECLDLPPFVRTSVYFDMAKEQRRAYDSMKDESFAILKSGAEVEASNVLSRVLRLQTIACGFLADESVDSSARLAALDYAIELTQGKQFLIWTIFQFTYDDIAKFLKEKNISFGMLVGSTPAELRQENIDNFQVNKLRCLLCHPKAGGVGTNLTAAEYSIHYSKDFNLVNDLQCEARNYRGGSEIHERITRIDILAQDSVDEKVHEALVNKKSVQDFILDLRQSI